MTQLPIHEVLPELRTQLAGHQAVILSAPPGSGKTTVAPLALLAEPWLAGRTILILEPRRLAARLAAAFMARQLGEEVGGTVGYRVRFEAKVSPATKIEVVTEGVLTRRVQDDPGLAGVGLVIFDEFHERSLQGDLALALCLDVMGGLRDDLKLLIMSATLDTEAVSRLLADAPVVMGAGRSYPVGVEYCPAGQAFQAQPSPREIAKQMATAIHGALREQPGDILAFLPGGAEIRHTQTLLAAGLPPAQIAIHPLYGDLSLSAQTAAVQPDPKGKRRIILATPIAETSITIEGIHTVVDSGWKRSPRFDPNSGLSRLTTQRISRASATQRAGRAGRLGPGHCYRLWSMGEEHGLKPFDPPEILNADLSQLVLDLARWGVHAPEELTWLDPPPAGHFAQAQSVLLALGALDPQNRITPLGKKMAELPAHPRLGHMLLAAAEHNATPLACDLAALLSERDILKGRDRSTDIEERLHALAAFRRDGPAAARALEADIDGCRRVIQTSRQLQEHLPKPARNKAGGATATPGELLALAFPDRIGQRRGESRGSYKLASGRGAVLPAHDRLAASEYLAVAELDAGKTEGRIFLAAPLAKDSLLSLFAARLQREEKVAWDEQSHTVKAQRFLRLGELVLETAPLAKPPAEAVLDALLCGIRSLGLGALPWSDKARELQARLICMQRWQPAAGWPDLSDPCLLETLEQWLPPYLTGMRSLEQLKKLDLFAILAARLDWQQQSRLDREAPTHLTVPSDSKVRLHYTPGEPPVLAVRLQEMFGLADTPRVCNNTIPVLLHLLSPARRPMQITQDLRGFWEGAYHEVKKELRGRYPKHHWPDDPLAANATARTKPKK